MSVQIVRVVLILLLLLIMAQSGRAEPAPGDMVQVTLSGGARITALLLRRNEQNIVVDLGHDVLTIQIAQVLDIRLPSLADSDQKKEQDIYTIGRLESAAVPALVHRYGDAVVIVKTPGGLGSGFFISVRGHLITNYHVIEKTTSISVTMFQRTGNRYEKLQFKRVQIQAVQPLRDLALLKIDPYELEGVTIKHVVIAEKDPLRVGDIVFAVGNPLGLERSVTQGIISSTTRTMGHLRFFQTDASINPGNSGGPLFNARGEVVGVVCAGYVFFSGLAFGIPGSDLVDFLTHRDAYLYDPAQPQNGVTYLPPPYRAVTDESGGDPEDGSDAKD